MVTHHKRNKWSPTLEDYHQFFASKTIKFFKCFRYNLSKPIETSPVLPTAFQWPPGNTGQPWICYLRSNQVNLKVSLKKLVGSNGALPGSAARTFKTPPKVRKISALFSRLLPSRKPLPIGRATALHQSIPLT